MGLCDITIYDVICKNALLCGDRVAIVCGEDRLTFGQYSREVDRLASGLVSLGVEKGDRIGVMALNCHKYLLLYGAAARLGAIMLPINWRLKPEEIEWILEDCTPKVMVSSHEFTDVVTALVGRCSFVTHRLVLGGGVQGFHPIDEVAAFGGQLKEEDVTQQDPFVIIHTAAVEGRSRGAVLTHGNMIAANLQAMALMGMQAFAVHLNLMPFFHIAGLITALHVMHAGGRNVIMKRFDAKEAVTWIEQEKVTIIETFPPMLSMILDQAEGSGQNLASLRIAGGLDNPETIQRCQQMTAAKFWTGFGQTETTGVCTYCAYDEQPGSIGKEGPFIRLRVVDDYDHEVPIGQSGEIVVRGPLVFKEYLNLESETIHTFRKGWHHTGDIGRLNEKGYLWYVKRKAEKELIKPGGENVYPVEVEKVLLEHPDVLEACVFGVPDREWGEAIKAVCVRKMNSALMPNDLIEFVASRIARYKKPKYMDFVETLPKTEEGILDREKIKVKYGKEA